MWDSPELMNAVSRLILAGTLLFALSIGGHEATERWLPVHQVVVNGDLHPETRAAVKPALEGLSGSFFSFDLSAIGKRLNKLPWVHAVTVRRVWPDTLVVEIEERTPLAAWNDREMVDRNGVVFPVAPTAGLPRFYSASENGKEMVARYSAFKAVLSKQQREIALLTQDARGSWQVVLAGGPTLQLGTASLDARMRRFASFYPQLAGTVQVRRIDLRYPNGFAVEGQPIVSPDAAGETVTGV